LNLALLTTCDEMDQHISQRKKYCSPSPSCKAEAVDGTKLPILASKNEKKNNMAKGSHLRREVDMDTCLELFQFGKNKMNK